MTTETQKTVGDKMKEAIADKTTTNIIEKALNNDNVSLLNNTFTELVSVKEVKYLCSINDTILKSQFWENDEFNKSGEKWDMESHFKEINTGFNELLITARSEGLKDNDFIKTKKTYSRSKNGRLFVDGFGLQKCQNKIRKFLSGKSSYDIDMKKCHWQIIAKLCEIHDIGCSRIKEFLKKPDELMEKHKVDKHDLLQMLFIDNYRSKNEFLQQLHKQKNNIFDELSETKHFLSFNFKPSEKSIKDKNTLSSVIAQYLQHLECEILIPVINKYAESVEVLMFDGFQINKAVNIDDLLIDLKIITGFDWCQKDNTFEPNNWEEEELTDYMSWAEEFEKKHFIVENPLQYCKIESNDIITYKKTDFKDLNEPVLEQINKWLKDKYRKSYKRFIMNPFQKGTEDPTAEDEFNLWKGFKADVVQLSEDYFPTEFYDLLYNSLCYHENEDTRKQYTDWTIKYISFLIQKPEILPQVGLVFESNPGSGKDLFGKILEALMGKHTITITDNPNSVFNGMKGGDNFNKDAEGKKLIILNESVTSEMKELMDKIKHYVTSDELIVNKKNKDTYTVRDVGALFIFTNNKFPLQQHDRRFVTQSAKSWTNISDSEKEKFFKPKWDLLYNDDEINKLFTWLNNYPIHDWKPFNNRLVTNATQESKNFAIPDYVWYLKEHCDDQFNRYSVYKNDSNLRCVSSMKDFWDDYKSWLKEYKNSNYAKTVINKIVKNNLSKINGITFDRFTYNGAQCRGVLLNIQEINDWINSQYKF